MNLWDSSRADELTETSVEKQHREILKLVWARVCQFLRETPPNSQTFGLMG